MITFIAHLHVKPDNAAAFETLMNYVTDMTRKHEAGVAYYGFAKSVDEPDTYVVVEVYQDPEAQAKHMTTDWVRDSLPKSARLIEGKPGIKQYVTPGSAPVIRRMNF
jgi:quinol monooxygenase YgiN